jgi:hypothetical protein
MRSDLIFGALKRVSNRFFLAKALATATRACHKPGTRIQNTTNDVLASFGCVNPLALEDAVPIATDIPYASQQTTAGDETPIKTLEYSSGSRKSAFSTRGFTTVWQLGKVVGTRRPISSPFDSK